MPSSGKLTSHISHPASALSSILERDTDLALPSCTIVSASAGSGKTYTLTQRFIQLLLSDHVPHNGLRNILAITFTNKAANEMKHKVMAYLQEICLSDQEKLEEMAKLVSMSKDRLQEKARVVLDEIYRNFSDLQIRTIDSFMSTVFKTSSFDFNSSRTLIFSSITDPSSYRHSNS
jgi:ATP-dependent exoDNAse (exonuclease V) beta subunit